LSLDAKAALGVDSTSWFDSNCKTAQPANIAGNVAAQSACNVIMRVIEGSSAAILSWFCKKSVTPREVGFFRSEVLAGTKVEGRIILRPYHKRVCGSSREKPFSGAAQAAF
jgi:hypothetical protein